MLSSAERWGGGEDERPYLPRAFSYARAREGELSFLLEDVGPGTARLAELRPGEGLDLVGPLGIGWRPPGEGTRPVLVGGGIGTAPLLCLQDELGAEVTVLLGFRSAAHAEAAGLFAGEPALATDDGSAGRQALVTDLLREELDADPSATVFACGPPAMLESVRAVCAELAVPAQLALESGMACGFGACFGCVVPTRDGYIRLCVDGPVLEQSCSRCQLGARAPRPPWNVGQIQPGGSHPQTPVERRPAADDPAGRPLRRPARRADPERLGHLRRDRRQARLRRRSAGALPLPRVRLEDDHAGAARGQPAAAAVGDARGTDQLDRPAQQGPRGLPGSRPARAGRAAGAAGRLGDGLQPRRAGDARRAHGGEGRGRADRAERVVPERRDGPRDGGRPRRDGARGGGRPAAHRPAADREAHPERDRPRRGGAWPRRRPAPTRSP